MRRAYSDPVSCCQKTDTESARSVFMGQVKFQPGPLLLCNYIRQREAPRQEQCSNWQDEVTLSSITELREAV
jgi:hypothetical protein